MGLAELELPLHAGAGIRQRHLDPLFTKRRPERAIVDQRIAERIEALDVASLEVGGLGLALADITQVQRYLDAVKVRLTQRAGALAEEGRGAPASETVRRGCREEGERPALLTIESV